MTDLLTRISEKIDIDHDTGCWLWQGTINPQGYAHIWFEGTTRGVHRMIYTLLVEEIPEGLQIDHLCRVRHCVNPDHLEPVTARENTLRGETVAARNAAVTHCPQGHPYDEGNTYYIPKSGHRYRVCKACRRDKQRQRRHRRSGR